MSQAQIIPQDHDMMENTYDVTPVGAGELWLIEPTIATIPGFRLIRPFGCVWKKNWQCSWGIFSAFDLYQPSLIRTLAPICVV